jgi:hypothetical protein
MAHGRSIRIYLADGSAAGIRHAEILNWTGQAIVCPRTRIAELKGWAESQRPGVYFLIGDDPDRSRPLVYVGEAENVYDRLKQHAKDEQKDFFDQVLLFTSKDTNLTKAHVKYLESRIVELVRVVDRVNLFNTNTPPRPSLPRPDRAAMEEFLGPARLLMAALGFFALQPLSSVANTPEAGAASSTDGPSGPLASTVLYLEIPKRGVTATGLSTDEGFVVQKGSVGAAAIRDSLYKGWISIRNELVKDGSVVLAGPTIHFMRDALFRSSSAAASIVSGGKWGGPDAWRTEDGIRLKTLEEDLLKHTEMEEL